MRQITNSSTASTPADGIPGAGRRGRSGSRALPETARSLFAGREWVGRGNPRRGATLAGTMDRVVMTRGVPAGEGGYHDAPTAPLPSAPRGDPGGPFAGRAETAGGQPPGTAEQRRLPRWLRRVLIAVLAIALAGALAFAALLAVTPSVSTAPFLAPAFDRAHGAPDPGPPGPSRVRPARGAPPGPPVY